MSRLPQIAMLPDGKRLHLQDGPIDLIIEAIGMAGDIRAAYEAAGRRFTGLLDELCAELAELRQAADPARCALQGVVARRMHAAVAPYAADCFITPMAAVAGAVAEEILRAMCDAAPLDRAYVNNGGDIALHLARSERFCVGLMDRPDRQGVIRTTIIDADDPSPSSPTPSICPGIPPSSVVRPASCSRIATSVSAWSRAMSADSQVTRSRRRLRRGKRVRANCSPPD